MMKTYHNFDLLITSAQNGYCARVIGSPMGESPALLFALPFTAADSRDFFGLSGQIMGSRDPHSRQGNTLHTQEFGERLFAALFADNIGALFRRSLDAVARENAGLRIRLRLNDVPELADLPWEFLYAPDLGRFPALSHWTPIVRYIEQDQPTQLLALSTPLTLLAVLSNPGGDFEPLNVEQEWERLQKALTDLDANNRIRLERLATPTMAALQDRLRQGPVHIVHFIGHGYFDEDTNEGGLVLQNEEGEGVLVGSARIGALFHDYSTLRLIFLNACEGARGGRTDPFGGVAQKLVQQGMPAVLAMQFEVSDAAAVTLAQEFYEAIADGLPVDAAVAEARKAVYGNGNPYEWGTPVLFSRSPDNALFTPLPAAAASADSPDAGTRHINTGGGSYFEGNVTAGRDVAGRDIVHIYNYGQSVESTDPLADFERHPFEPEIRLVPAGSFVMGRDPGAGVAAHETRRHIVMLDAFRIGKCPVTNGELALFLEAERRTAPPELGWPGQRPATHQRDLPVAGVTWKEALDYCGWLSKKTGRFYTLPSEAQWERAARGTDGRLFPWGDEWDPARCNTNPERVTPCHAFEGGVSPAGCLDMVGNVREWTTTMWGEKRVQPDPAFRYPWQEDGRDNIEVENNMMRRVFRGGARAKQDLSLTVTLRGGELPTQRGLAGMRMGFRIAIQKANR